MLPPSLQYDLLSLNESIADTQALIEELRQAVNGTRDPIELRKYKADIIRLRGYINEYSKEYEELTRNLNADQQQIIVQNQEVSNQLQKLHSNFQQLQTTLDQVDEKVEQIADGQVIVYQSLQQIKHEVLAQYDAGEQRIIQNVFETLNQHQMYLVQVMLSTFDRLSQEQVEAVLNIVEERVLPALPPGATEAVSIIKDPSLDVKHRLKVAIPLFPFIDLESEFELGSGIDVLTALEKVPKELWRRITNRLAQRR